MRFRTAAALTLAVALAGCATTAPRPDDLTRLSVVEAAQLIRAKKITSLDLTLY